MKQVFYHGTSEQNANNILKEGFKPFYGRFGEAVYLAPTSEEAKRFGQVVLAVKLRIESLHTEAYERLASRYPGTSIEEEEGITELKEYVVQDLGIPAIQISYTSGESELCVYDVNIIESVSILGVEEAGATYLVRDEKGHIFNQVTNPAVVFDRRDSVMHKIGEYEAMETYFNATQQAYRGAGFHDIADDMVLMELPKDQEIIDKVFLITGYIGVLYKEIMQKERVS